MSPPFHVYIPAVVEPCGKVFVWLGADVMVEYTHEEAEALLSKNLALAQTKLSEKAEDLDYLRDQIITAEVNMARFFNFEVLRKKAAGGSEAS